MWRRASAAAAASGSGRMRDIGVVAASAAAALAAPAVLLVVPHAEALSLGSSSASSWGHELDVDFAAEERGAAEFASSVAGGAGENWGGFLRGYPVAQQQQALREFGQARYSDSQPLATWEDLEELGRLGSACDPGKSVIAQCGRDLVCRQGICRRCIQDTECPSLHTCEGAKFGTGQCVRIEAKAWERALSDPSEGLCTFMIFFASALAAAAGTGGGGMFVPLLVSLSGLKAENAVPLSQAMILGGSVINLSVFLSQRHPEVSEQPVIDYDCVVLLEPMLCFGVMVGVLINQISPQWMLLLLLILSLGLALYRTASKGMKQLKAEFAQPAPAPAPVAEASPSAPVASSSADPAPTSPQLPPSSAPQRAKRRSCFDQLVNEDFLELTDKKAWQIILTVTIWVFMLACSFHGLSVCTWRFAGFILEICAGLLFITFVAGRRIQRIAQEAETQNPGKKAFDWTSKGPLHFPMVAFGAGFLGGLLGIGGGMIMSPVLVEVGMHSEAVQATTAVFVFLSSSLATIQFARLKQHVWHYVIWYVSVTVIATCVGQKLCDIYVRKHKRYSLITLAISGVLLSSLVALVCIGVFQVVEDFYMGRQMWFAMDGLCNKNGAGIIAVDVAPADSWPTDLPRYQQRR